MKYANIQRNHDLKMPIWQLYPERSPFQGRLTYDGRPGDGPRERKQARMISGGGVISFAKVDEFVASYRHDPKLHSQAQDIAREVVMAMEDCKPRGFWKSLYAAAIVRPYSNVSEAVALVTNRAYRHWQRISLGGAILEGVRSMFFKPSGFTPGSTAEAKREIK